MDCLEIGEMMVPLEDLEKEEIRGHQEREDPEVLQVFAALLDCLAKVAKEVIPESQDLMGLEVMWENQDCVGHKECQDKPEHLVFGVQWDQKVNLVHQVPQDQQEMDQVAQ